MVSLTWLGTKMSAITSATTTSGSVIRNTEPHQKLREQGAGDAAARATAMPPPSADHSAIDFVRPGPDHSAVIRARVVG